MAETRIARPYAKAVFDFALEKGELASWNEKLDLLAGVSENDVISEMVTSPRVTTHQMAEALIKVCGDKVGEFGQNLIKLLAKNRRVSVLPEIRDQYEKLRAESEQTIEAELVTAHQVDDAQVATLGKALEKKLGRAVKLTSRIDESLMGGAIIRTGDLVIDGSVTAKLQRLTSVLGQ